MKRCKLNFQKEYVRIYPWHIKDIRSPLPVVQLAAVKSDYLAILHIKKPCRAVQMYCARHAPELLNGVDIHPDVKQYLLFKEL